MNGQAQANLGQNGNISFSPDENNPGKVVIQAGNKTWTWDQLKYQENAGHTKLNHGSSNIRQLIGIWAPKQPETRHGDAAKQGFNGDTEEGGETGVIEPIEDEEGRGVR